MLVHTSNIFQHLPTSSNIFQHIPTIQPFLGVENLMPTMKQASKKGLRPKKSTSGEDGSLATEP
jgi:hypothetical protein